MAKHLNRETDSPFGQWIIEQLDNKGWGQSDLARACNLGQSTISGYMNGLKRPRYNSDVINIARAVFMGESEEEYERFEDSAFIAAGFVPERLRASFTNLVRETQEIIYSPALENCRVAYQTGNIDDEGKRRLEMQIQALLDLETKDTARRRGL